MTLTFTKYFYFSAAHERAGRVYGHNYVLGVTVEGTGEEERLFPAEKIEREFIGKLESRDLGLDVDFLKGATLTEGGLLRRFWPILQRMAAPHCLRSLSLQSDRRTFARLSEGSDGLSCG